MNIASYLLNEITSFDYKSISLLLGIQYTIGNPCKRDTSKIILLKANGEKEVLLDKDAEEIIKSIERDLKKKDQHIFKDLQRRKLAKKTAGHKTSKPEEKDSTVYLVTKQLPKRGAKKTVYKEETHHHDEVRQINSSPEQGIWAWRGKKEMTNGQKKAKRNWSYFSSKMKNIMKKQPGGRPYGDDGELHESGEYQLVPRPNEEDLIDAVEIV